MRYTILTEWVGNDRSGDGNVAIIKTKHGYRLRHHDAGAPYLYRNFVAFADLEAYLLSRYGNGQDMVTKALHLKKM